MYTYTYIHSISLNLAFVKMEQLLLHTHRVMQHGVWLPYYGKASEVIRGCDKKSACLDGALAQPTVIVNWHKPTVIVNWHKPTVFTQRLYLLQSLETNFCPVHNGWIKNRCNPNL